MIGALTCLALMVLGLSAQCYLMHLRVTALSETAHHQADAIAALIRGNNSIIDHLQAQAAPDWTHKPGKEWRS